jgi:hypothetical protein
MKTAQMIFREFYSMYLSTLVCIWSTKLVYNLCTSANVFNLRSKIVIMYITICITGLLGIMGVYYCVINAIWLLKHLRQSVHSCDIMSSLQDIQWWIVIRILRYYLIAFTLYVVIFIIRT